MIDKIKQDRKLLEKQLFWVEISFNECTSIGVKSEYTVEEFGKFETLCSRYSRGIDFLIRKLFRSIDGRGNGLLSMDDIGKFYMKNKTEKTFDQTYEMVERKCSAKRLKIKHLFNDLGFSEKDELDK